MVAGTVWQILPSWLRGSDSHHPLQLKKTVWFGCKARYMVFYFLKTCNRYATRGKWRDGWEDTNLCRQINMVDVFYVLKYSIYRGKFIVHRLGRMLKGICIMNQFSKYFPLFYLRARGMWRVFSICSSWKK